MYLFDGTAIHRNVFHIHLEVKLVIPYEMIGYKDDGIVIKNPPFLTSFWNYNGYEDTDLNGKSNPLDFMCPAHYVETNQLSSITFINKNYYIGNVFRTLGHPALKEHLDRAFNYVMRKHTISYHEMMQLWST